MNGPSDPIVASRTASFLDLKSHPNSHILRVLTDVSLLLQDGPKDSHETLKLRFYAGYILSIPSAMISAYMNELKHKALELSDSESPSSSSSPSTRRNGLAMNDEESARSVRAAGLGTVGATSSKIEEL